jgi:hypothetical protein
MLGNTAFASKRGAGNADTKVAAKTLGVRTRVPCMVGTFVNDL